MLLQPSTINHRKNGYYSSNTNIESSSAISDLPSYRELREKDAFSNEPLN
jgi:hypothetical protein